MKNYSQNDLVGLREVPGRERCEIIAEYMIEKQCTVRAAAVRFCLSKSTVHKDVTRHLKERNPALYAETALLLEKNKAERHLRGGEATRRKYCLLAHPDSTGKEK